MLQKWILELPASKEQEKARQDTFRAKVERLISDLVHIKVQETSNIIDYGDCVQLLTMSQLVFSHCDLLGGNIIIKLRKNGEATFEGAEEVDSIDFEYDAYSHCVRYRLPLLGMGRI